jgi:superfamily II RNA helicase
MTSPTPQRASGGSSREEFLAALSFQPDLFQLESLDAIDEENNLIVSAPTGSGKTLIAAYGVDRALERNDKAFYTTPLKALSNQKFVELIARYGEGNVGLLTGDAAIRAHAPVVVMTTEVLRNMLLTKSPLLEGLGAVILDEVHFLQDPYRGGVWEEVLILTPPAVQFICLSATVANARVLGEWIESLQGPTSVVVERHRPIKLRNHVAVVPRSERVPKLVDLLAKGRASEEGLRIDQANRRAGRSRGSWSNGRDHGPPRAFGQPRRNELLELLDDRSMLPAIFFIFSRAACDEAVRNLVRDGARFVSRSERPKIRTIAEHFVEQFDDDELDALGYGPWLEGLEAGIAAHHAGLVPAFREAVEVLFSQGLLGVVFATETLSLGINMPARSVVLERFSKFGGAGRSTLTSGEYAQLTGRAGRRGLDEEGHAVVCYSYETSIAEMARVALAPPPDLHSSFRPTYNLACSLIPEFTREQASAILASSFAQFEADRRPGEQRRSVADLFTRRLAVLEELDYVDGWHLTARGHLLRTIYHEADLLIAHAHVEGIFDGLEPALLAGVLSSFIFEPRRARHTPGSRLPRRAKKKGALPDRLGHGRRRALSERCESLVRIAATVHQVEEVHMVSRSRSVESGLSTAVSSWARGASLGTALDVAAADVGEVSPGDFVRVMRQVADLADQLSQSTGSPELAEAARAVVPMVLRSVVAGGSPGVSASPRPAPL